jgi:hypothetical protein
MFWTKKPDPNPLGVRLCDLKKMLEQTSIVATLRGNVLLARHEHYTTRIEVLPPENCESENGPIQAVVRVITDLPTPVQSLFQGREAAVMAAYNSFAGLGALYGNGGTVQIGSRLTIYQAEDAWGTLHLPMLLFTTICGSEAILGGLRRTMTNEEERGGESEFTDSDLEQVAGYLSGNCVCTVADRGLTAEFSLTDGNDSAVFGDQKTALFQLFADQPHPELGGGLFCLLQLPHQVHDEDHLQRLCLQLNDMEMEAHDLPPHFGAWCPARSGNTLAYATFLPNALHSVSGVAINNAFWAMNRAQWANALLASLGVSA